MPLYANYISNPSFELGTASWSVKHPEARDYTSRIRTQISRVSTGAVAGSYALRIATTSTTYHSYGIGRWGGAYTVVDIDPAAGQPYTLSWQASNFTVPGRSSNYHQGIRVGVWAFSGNVTVPEQWSDSSNFSGYTPTPLATFAASKSTSRQSLTFTPPSNATKLLILFESTCSYPVVDWDFDNFGTAQCSIDAIKLEQGTLATTYGDGTYAGWSWSGEPHNSPSRRAVDLQAAGYISVTGVFEELRKHKEITASGDITVTGDLIDVETAGTVSASGSSSMDGDIEMWYYSGQIKADGVIGLTGNAPLAAIIEISASGTAEPGTGPNAPKITIDKAWGMQASGSSSMDGSIVVTFPQNISGSSGHISVTGTGLIDIGLQMSSYGTMVMSGELEITDAEPPGSFADFSIFGTSEEDPYFLGIGPTNAPLASGAQNSDWARVYAEFAAPADLPNVWMRAAYAAVGFQFSSMPASTYQELTCVQVEPSVYGDPGPRDYKTPQTITPLVVADRANLATGEVTPFIDNNGSLHVEEGGTSPAPGERRKIQQCVRDDNSSEAFFLANAVDFPEGEICTFSCWIRPGDGVEDIKITPINSDDWADRVADPVWYSDFEADGDGWARVRLTFTARKTMFIHFEVTGDDTYPQVFEVAGILWELTDTVKDYFDMQLGSLDYYYRDNGEDDDKGVFWYPNIEQRWPVLVQALQQQAPHGVRIGEPQFGKFRHLD